MPTPSSPPKILIRKISDVLVVAVYGDDSPSNEEWQDYLVVVRSMASKYRMVIFSSGGGPTTMQRGDLEDVTSTQEGSKVAVVTASRTARGIVTAIGWFNRDIKAFAPSKHDDAFSYLELSPEEIQKVLNEAREMAETLGIRDIMKLN